MALANENNQVAMEMTTQTEITHPEVQWWAMYLLGLGSKGDYDKLMHWLEMAKNAGSLTVIRLAADKLVRARTPKKVRSIRKASGTFKAVA